jgi:hypothetical protein
MKLALLFGIIIGGEIVGSTIRNYVKVVKLLCGLNEIPILWNRSQVAFQKGGNGPTTWHSRLTDKDVCW